MPFLRLVRRDVVLLHLRLSLPDRPGALGLVARALARTGSDICSVVVLDQEEGRVTDDIFLTCAVGRAGATVSSVAALPGVLVLGSRVARSVPGALGDLHLVEQLLAAPMHAVARFVDAVPDLLDADWAMAADDSGNVTRSITSPDTSPAATVVSLVGPMPVRAVARTGASGLALLVGPLPDGGVVVVSREDGLPFHRSEVRHLDQLLGLLPYILRRATSVDLGAGAGRETSRR